MEYQNKLDKELEGLNLGKRLTIKFNIADWLQYKFRMGMFYGYILGSSLTFLLCYLLL